MIYLPIFTPFVKITKDWSMWSWHGSRQVKFLTVLQSDSPHPIFVVYLSGVQCAAWKKRWMKPVVPVVIKHWIVSNFFSPSLQKKCSNWLHCFHPSLFGFPIATRCVSPQLLPQCATATRQSPWSTLIPHTRWDNCWQRRFWIFPQMDRLLLAMVKNGWPQTWILLLPQKNQPWMLCPKSINAGGDATLKSGWFYCPKYQASLLSNIMTKSCGFLLTFWTKR